MKLHLPVVLLTALMAVLTALPSQGSVVLKHYYNFRGEDYEEVFKDSDAQKPEFKRKNGTDYSELTIDGGSELVFDLDRLFRTLRGSFDVTVREGGMLTMPDTGSSYGNNYGFFDGNGSWEKGSVNLTIDGGTVDMGNNLLGYVNGDRGWSDEGRSLQMEVKITNGTLRMRNGSLGKVNMSYASLEEKITINGGGVLQALSDSTIGYGANSLKIHLLKDSKMEISGKIGGFSYGGTSNYPPTQQESLTYGHEIIVDEGSELVLTSGKFSWWGTAEKELTCTATLKVDGGHVTIGSKEVNSSFEYGYNHYGSHNVTTNLVLNSGSIDVYAKTFGIGGDSSYSDGTHPSTETYITINGGEFTIHEQEESEGKEYVKGIKIQIDINGGITRFHRGKVVAGLGSKQVGSSVLNLNGGELTIDSKARFTGNINVTGGSLTFGEGCYLGGLSAEGNGKADPDMKTVTIDIASTWNEAVTLNGLDAKYIISNEETGFKIKGAGATLQGLLAGSTLTLSGADNTLTVSSKSSGKGEGSTKEGKTPLIGFAEGEEKGTVQFKDADTQVTLNFDDDNLKTLAKAAEENQEEVSFEVWITNGTLKDYEGGSDIAGHFMVGTGWGLKVEPEPTVSDAQDGRLMITGNIANVAFTDKEGTLSEAEKADKVVVMDDTTLTVDEPEGTIKQLEGAKDKNLTLEGKGTVSLENQHTAATNGDTTFKGDIITENGVDLKKTGNAELAVEGNLQAGGNVTVEDGTLTLGGDDNSIDGKLSIEKDGALQVEEDSKLTLNGKDNDLKDVTSDQLTGSGSITVGKDGKLTLKSDTVNDSDLTFGADAGGRLELTGDTPVDLGKLAEDTTGTVKGAEFTSTDKDASFAGSIEGKLTVEGGSLNMSNTENGGCDLYVVGKDTQATIAAGSKYHSITVGDNDRDNDKLVVSANEENGKAGAGIRVTGDIVFRRGAETDFTLNLNDPDLWGSGEHDATMLSTERTIYIEQGTTFVIDCLESSLSGTHNDLRDVVILEGTNIENPEAYNAPITARILVSDALSENTREGEKEVVKADVRLGTILDQLYENVKMTQDGQKVYINADARTESPWMSYATTGNSVAGLNLLWKALSNAGGAVDPQVEGMFHALQNLLNESPAEARRVMAAVAGSTLTSLSAAQSAALRNQMGRVRDHALQAGRLRCAGNADEATAQQRPCKNSHVWVEGTGFFSEQHSVGDESGYRLNSWGGALGIDAQVDAHWSVGVSLSASYGDLEARAADYAKGDLDTYTVSFWSQAKNGRWGNTLLFTLGTNEADLKRTVNYGAGSYTATSNTSGSSLGAMWELTYDFHPVKDNKSNILQPLFNVALTRTSMDGFSEKNAGNVGLTTEKQTRDTVTLGLGLRWLAAINSAKALNRTVSTEVHANVAQDMGDRRSVANVALLADPSYTQNVYGSKAGSTAFQFGAGVNVPMTPNSQIYVNAGGELREHANAWNAALGVRMGF